MKPWQLHCTAHFQRTKKKKSSGEPLEELPYTYLLAESIITLGQTEAWFWESEPRLVLALVEKKNEIKQIEQKNLAAYIACCVWGKDPSDLDGTNEERKKKKKVPGRDVPIDPELLRGFYG